VREKQRLIQAIPENEVVDLTQKLVRIPSLTGSEKEIAQFIYDYSRSSDLSVSLIDVESSRPNVMVRLKGKGEGPTILLNGHMDTVPPGEGWTQDPFAGEAIGNFIYGRGAADMKGGLAVFIVAMKALKQSGLEFPGEIIFVGVVGEEENQLGTKHLIRSGLKADYAIVTEPTELRVVNAHKGAINCEITVNGRAAHASTPEQGLNAIYHAGRLALAFEDYASQLKGKSHPVLGSPTFVVGTIQGGQVPYMVADYCKLSIDRRLIPGETYEGVFREIEDVIALEDRKSPGFKTSAKLTVTSPPMETDPRSAVVVSLRRNAAEVLGVDSGCHGWPAVSDGNLLVEKGIPTALFGPGSVGRMAHKPDEGVEIDQLKTATKIIALTLFDLLKGPA